MNTLAWIAWLVQVMALITAGRNPFYLILIWLALQFLYALWMDSRSGHLFILSPLQLSLFIVITAALLNTLTSHFGETILFRIPGNVILISGNVTLEAIVYGALNGLVLSNILTAFMLINLALPTHLLTRLIPKSYHALAIVISIAIAFLPSARRQLALVREAHAIRGRSISSVRDYFSLLMPILIGGMEHAVQLAETMTARGFASVSSEVRSSYHQLAMLLGLLLILGSWIVHWFKPWQAIQNLLLALGILTIAGSLWIFGHQTKRTSYHKEHWSWLDILAVIAAGISLMIYFDLFPGLDTASLHYNPYPAVGLPGFNPALGFVILGLLLPVFAHLKETG